MSLSFKVAIHRSHSLTYPINPLIIIELAEVPEYPPSPMATLKKSDMSKMHRMTIGHDREDTNSDNIIPQFVVARPSVSLVAVRSSILRFLDIFVNVVGFRESVRDDL